MNRKILKILLIFTVIFVYFSDVSLAQVVVEKSKNKVIISGKPYYIHIVKKGETAYSISRAYGITVEELTQQNPNTATGIKEGQSLRLPVVDVISKPSQQVKLFQAERDENKFIYHKLSSGDTVYSLAKKYGVSENEIIQSNVGVEINKLPVGAEIAIPKRQFITTSRILNVPEKGFIYHKVQSGESIASIAEKYGLTVREIRRENRSIWFPKVDDSIRIPVNRITETKIADQVKQDSVITIIPEKETVPERPVGFTPVGPMKGKLNIALMLPLYIKENSERTEIDSSQIIKGKRIKKVIARTEQWIYPEGRITPFLELYQGILIAADTLSLLGLDINLHVYDIKSDTIGVTRLIESGELRNMDLIIGPVYSKNLSIVAAYAGPLEIPVVSPVPLRSNSLLVNNPFLFMANPSLEVAQEEIAGRVGEYPNNNFVFIRADSANSDTMASEFKNRIIRELTSKMPYEEIKFKEFLYYNRTQSSNDTINRLEHSLTDKCENLVLIASEDSPVLTETIADIHTLSKKYPIKLIGYPAMRDLENIDPKDYFDLGIELYTPYWIDYDKPDVKSFNKCFRNKFLTFPSESSFAWQGYDIAYYFISGLAIHGKHFISNPEIHNPALLETAFDFRRPGDGNGFENHKLFLIKYTNEMEVKLLDKNNSGH
jgi:LysM repeat protein